MLKSIHFYLSDFYNWYVHLICLFTFTPLLSIPLWEPCGFLILSVCLWGLNQIFKGVDLHKWVSLVLFSMIFHPHTWTSILYDLLHIREFGVTSNIDLSRIMHQFLIFILICNSQKDVCGYHHWKTSRDTTHSSTRDNLGV